MKCAENSVCFDVLAAIITIIIRLQKSYQNVSLMLRSLAVVVVWGGGVWDYIWRWIMGKTPKLQGIQQGGLLLFFLNLG